MMIGSCNKDYVTRGLSLEKSYVTLHYFIILLSYVKIFIN